MNNLEAALNHARQGVAVFPCNADKQPLTQHGFKDATTDLATVRRWWTHWPDALIGAPTGLCNGFSVLDLDVKHGHNGFASVPDYETRSNTWQRTPSGGAHLFFAAEGSPGNTAGRIADGVDTRGEGGYVILYDANLHFGFQPPWPDDLRPPEHATSKPNGHAYASHEEGWLGTPYGLSAIQRELGRLALTTEGNRNVVLNEVFFALFQLADRGDLNRQYIVIEVTRVALLIGLPKKEITNTLKSATKGAAAKPRDPIEEDPRYLQTEEQQAEGGSQADGIMPSRLKRKKGPLSDVPEHLLSPPGWLGAIAKFYNNTAPKSQPQFAIQTALALLSVLASRLYMTDQKNYASMYFLNVSQSATGKEHAKTVIEQLLEAADLTNLIGPSGYTSASGVFSALIQQPRHIAVIDELGRMLQSSHTSGNAHLLGAETQIMEASGRCGGTLRLPGYSKIGMTEKQVEGFDRNREVHHPGLVLLGMTTPRSLYENLNSHYITDGFLGRFVIVESLLPREVSNYVLDIPVPSELTEWMRDVSRADDSEPHNRGMPIADKINSETAPGTILIPFAPECREMLCTYERKLLDQMDILDQSRMESMLGRTKEYAQRMALIVAISCESSIIEPGHLQWAIDYVNFYAQRAVLRLRETVADGPFDAVRKAVFVAIKKTGIRGLTDSEISRSNNKFANLEPRRQREVMESLRISHDVTLRDIPSKGRPRRAWVAQIEDAEE